MHRESSTFSSPLPMNPNFPDHEHLKCPRCDSINTKFCYYNNYNLSQPRHFCKNCRRYWTKGGTLRNIPIGGGSRKITKRRSNSSKVASPVTESPPVPEYSVDRRFGGDLTLESGGGGGGSMGDFGRLLMDGSNFNLVSESREDVLVRRSIGGDFGSNLLRLNDDDSETGGGDREFPELSIFTPGWSFH